MTVSGRIASIVFALLCIPPVAAFDAFQPLPRQPPYPADNLPAKAKIALGKQLFFDRRLSDDRSVSCNSCHDLMSGGDDGRQVSVGVHGRHGQRSTPTLWNAAFYGALYQDGRSPSLEDQVQTHVLDADIMGLKDAAMLEQRIAAIDGYRQQFDQVFGGANAVTSQNIARAIADFERTLITPDSAFDRYLRGKKRALTEQQQRGFATFIETGCAACHFWVNLAGPQPGLQLEMGEGFWELFPNYLGSRYDQQYRLLDDAGRFHVTGVEGHRYMWRVPTLRNIAVTAPYFHNGSVATLDEAVRVMAKTQLNKEVAAADVKDIVAFLQSLGGRFPRIAPPGLPSEAAVE
ncbi:MAG: cytochrome c peroxidase [Gammaproteobacteria bacterium]|nr:MAG: cytochrome c peroxidase [Gammaproteobacteria bacterium]TND07007.1 MAG: cytochrome c peroxidase [Gammaproteobacteria bacterium]